MDAAPLEVLLMAGLRILVVLPMYGGSLPIGRYCVKALEHLGHNVRVFNAPLLYPGYQGVQGLDISPSRLRNLENSFLRFTGQAIWAQAEEQKPQLVLALAQAPLDHVILRKMKQANMRTAMWFVEDYRVFTYWRAYAPFYDAFAVIQKQPFLDELAAIGQTHAFYLPLAALPDFHKPVNLTAEEKKEYGSLISFLGAGYPNRRLAFRPLADKDFKIWGSDWEDETALKKNIQREGKRITEDESIKIYNAADINLNLHSSIHADKLVSNGDFINPRTFELAAMGAFQLVDHRELMPELFAEEELATFKDGKEFYEKIDYFSSRPEERRIYAQKARERVLRDHTYEKRMAVLLEYMEREFGPWPREENKIEPDIPAELAREIAELAQKLGLGPDAPFEDVIARLRRQSGKLTSLETSLLFLDEWQKQYKKPD